MTIEEFKNLDKDIWELKYVSTSDEEDNDSDSDEEEEDSDGEEEEEKKIMKDQKDVPDVAQKLIPQKKRQRMYYSYV